jgi:hypothetical protein
MTSEAQKTSNSLSCEDFDALVMDFVYEDGLSTNKQSQMQNHESKCGPCTELVATLRETHEMAQLITQLEPRPMLNAKILDMAKRPKSLYQFPRIVEPLGWLAAASLLLSCGYIVGLLTSSSAVRQDQLVAHKSIGSKANLASDLSEVIIRFSPSNKNKPAEITYNSKNKTGDYQWVGIKNMQCNLAQAENSLHDFDKNNKQRDLLLAYRHLQNSRRLVHSKSSYDGPRVINKKYHYRLKKIEQRIKEIAREKKIQLAPGG